MTTTTDLLRRAAVLLDVYAADGGGPADKKYDDTHEVISGLLSLAYSMSAPVVAQRMPYAGGFTAVVFDDKKVPPGTLVFAMRGAEE